MPKSFYFLDQMNQMSPDEIREYQESKLKSQLRYCYDHSEFYREKFDYLGLKPEDIRSMEDLRNLPIFMRKDDERKSAEASLEKYGHPFGLHLCAPVDEIYLTGTSGTTGTPTFRYTFTKKDMEFLSPRIAKRLVVLSKYLPRSALGAALRVSGLKLLAGPMICLL